MTRIILSIASLSLACSALWACGPSPGAGRTQSSAAAPAPPAKPMKMICKNSQNGLKAACGTPSAVMVGMEPA
jgi:hypothetical protein